MSWSVSNPSAQPNAVVPLRNDEVRHFFLRVAERGRRASVPKMSWSCGARARGAGLTRWPSVWRNGYAPASPIRSQRPKGAGRGVRWLVSKQNTCLPRRCGPRRPSRERCPLGNDPERPRVASDLAADGHRRPQRSPGPRSCRFGGGCSGSTDGTFAPGVGPILRRLPPGSACSGPTTHD
jgi:hypothetical protein